MPVLFWRAKGSANRSYLKDWNMFLKFCRSTVLSLMCLVYFIAASAANDSVFQVSAFSQRHLPDSVTVEQSDSLQGKQSMLLQLISTDSISLTPEVQEALDMVLFPDSIVQDDEMSLLDSPYFLPIIFDRYKNPDSLNVFIPFKKTYSSFKPFSYTFKEPEWLMRVKGLQTMRERGRFWVIINHPECVKYNTDNLPEVPKVKVMETSPRKNLLKLEDMTVSVSQSSINAGERKLKHWISGLQSSIQFSQVHISENWYQGGESNLNIVSNQVYTLKFDDYDWMIFENTVQWKVNVNSAPEDTIRKIRISEDLFQINSKFGFKAFKSWYYTATLFFKTQLFDNYKANTTEKLAEFLSPGEFNAGLGMSYNYKQEKWKFESSVVLSPFSYNLKFVANDRDINPANSGINAGNTLNQFGSSFEVTVKWEFYRNMKWSSRLFYFTNYEQIQSDFENSFDFILNRFFSTRLFLHLRYDDAREKKDRKTHFQFKELLSFGFNYSF